MAINLTDAAAAYNRTVKQQNAQGLEPRDQAKSGGFEDALRTALSGAVQTMNQGEQMSLAAAMGKADVNEVITAVSKAELTLQTVVALRDRVVQAYQEILRMPI